MNKEIDWLDSANYVAVPNDYDGPVYVTPEWVRHPERYPELLDRLSKFGKKWSELLEEKGI